MHGPSAIVRESGPVSPSPIYQAVAAAGQRNTAMTRDGVTS